MKPVVKKFGGTSVATLGCIRYVAEKIVCAQGKGERVVVVVSAMDGMTNQLARWIEESSLSQKPCAEGDVVLASGEPIAAGLLAMALQNLGQPARSWMGWQLPLLTTMHPGNAEILSVQTEALLQDLEAGIIPVVAGFQGVTACGRVTTLGRGGSDTTAVVLAAALKASVCQIFTDVDGVYTTDPAYVKDARRYDVLSYEDMLVLAEHGTKVLDAKAIRWAQKHNVLIQIYSTFSDQEAGTRVQQEAPSIAGLAQKTILRWHIPDMMPQEAQDLYEALQAQFIPFLEWQSSRYGLTFFTGLPWKTWVKSVLPQSLLQIIQIQEMSLITLVGKCLFSPTMACNLPIVHTIRFSNAIGLVFDLKHAHQAILTLHRELGFHDIP
jgi:aspartate kinase